MHINSLESFIMVLNFVDNVNDNEYHPIAS